MEEKKEILRLIQQYHQALNSLHYESLCYIPATTHLIKEGVPSSKGCYMNHRLEKKMRAERCIQVIEEAKEHIGEEYYTIIHQDFMIHSDKYWYLEYYSKATYYRKRKLAMQAFLGYMSLFLEFYDE